MDRIQAGGAVSHSVHIASILRSPSDNHAEGERFLLSWTVFYTLCCASADVLCSAVHCGPPYTATLYCVAYSILHFPAVRENGM